jgi:hypothetical protein
MTAREGERSARVAVRIRRDARMPRTLLLTEWLPPIADQGRQNSCVAWASAYYTLSYAQAQQRQLTPEQRLLPKHQYSPSYLYNQINRGEDKGANFAAAFEVLAKQGCATLAEMPYRESDTIVQPDDGVREKALVRKARAVGYLFQGTHFDAEAVQGYLNEARLPIPMGIPIYADFPKVGQSVPPDTIYDLTLSPDAPRLYHAITVVGYDLDKKAYRIVNSWGEGWGDKGFLWVAERFMERYAFDGWAQVPGGLVAREVRRGQKAPRTEPIATIQVVAPRRGRGR